MPWWLHCCDLTESFKLGSAIQTICKRFNLWGHEPLVKWAPNQTSTLSTFKQVHCQGHFLIFSFFFQSNNISCNKKKPFHKFQSWISYNKVDRQIFQPIVSKFKENLTVYHYSFVYYIVSYILTRLNKWPNKEDIQRMTTPSTGRY